MGGEVVSNHSKIVKVLSDYNTTHYGSMNLYINFTFSKITYQKITAKFPRCYTNADCFRKTSLSQTAPHLNYTKSTCEI